MKVDNFVEEVVNENGTLIRNDILIDAHVHVIFEGYSFLIGQIPIRIHTRDMDRQIRTEYWDFRNSIFFLKYLVTIVGVDPHAFDIPSPCKGVSAKKNFASFKIFSLGSLHLCDLKTQQT